MSLDPESLFLRGKEAADRGNYDYAVTLFRDTLRIAPEHRNTRIALRGCEMEKFRQRGGGLVAKVAAFFKGFVSLVIMHVPGMKPDKVMDHCERYLVNDPTDMLVLKRLARVCCRQGYLEAAADTLEFARRNKPKDVGVLRRLGEVHCQRRDYENALKCFREVRNIRPNDREASDRVKEISALAHLQKSGLQDAQGYRQTLRDEEGAEVLEREARMVHSSDEMQTEMIRLKQAAEANPQDPEAHMRFGDACYRFERYKEAEQAYQEAFRVGQRYTAREKMGDARMRRFEQAERKAEKEAEESGFEPRFVAAAREARRKKLEFCAKEFEFRRKQHPTDMTLAWNLGQYYLDLGTPEHVQKAIQQFQQAISSSGLKVRAQHMLGRCFAMDPKTVDMAKEQFLKALEGMGDSIGDTTKMIMYDLGDVAEKLGDRPEALSWYKKLFAIDAGYRDVAKKIQEFG